MAERLARGDVHLACMPAGDSRFNGRLLGPMHVLAVLPEKHALSRGAMLDIAELVDRPLLVLRREFGSRAWFDAACQVARVRPRLLLESTSPADAYRAGRSGLWNRDCAVDCGSASQWPSGNALGPSSGIDRQMAAYRLGCPALSCAVCSAVYPRAGRGLYPPRFSGT